MKNLIKKLIDYFIYNKIDFQLSYNMEEIYLKIDLKDFEELEIDLYNIEIYLINMKKIYYFKYIFFKNKKKVKI